MSPVAVVTGAARGIGAATVDVLVAAGWQVVAVDRAADDPAVSYPLASKSELEDLGARHGDAVRTVVGDVRHRSDMQSAVDEALRHFGGLQAAVAAAGVISGGPPLWETADEQWDVLFDVNVNGVRHLASAAVPALLREPEPRLGRVVAVASAAGPARPAPAQCLQRVEGSGDRLCARWPPTWPAPASRPTPSAPARPAGRCSMRRPPSTGWPSAEEFAGQQLD